MNLNKQNTTNPRANQSFLTIDISSREKLVKQLNALVESFNKQKGGLRPTNDFVIDVEIRLNAALDTNCKFIGLQYGCYDYNAFGLEFSISVDIPNDSNTLIGKIK